MENLLKSFSRKKPIDESFESPLRRCLIFFDLILLGIGGSVDVALYVVLGNVIRDIAGPAVLISMIIGFIACLGAGFCYAEFASYIPTSGSDYDYIYSSLGELCGFMDGWGILLGSVIATAALAQGAADLLSSLTDSATFNNIDAHVTLLTDHSLLASNFNIIATLIVILVTVITAIGVHGSVRFNDCIVIVNLLVIVFTTILGLCHVNLDYWSSWEKFAPYGVSGIIKALPFTIFFYGGFVSVTYSAEEVINPTANLPRSIIASLVGIFLAFMAVAIVLCLVIPYNQLPMMSPISDTFGIIAFKGSKYIIAIGGFCSCLSSVLTASYANSRLSYVMSRDGLINRFLQKVNKKTLVPINAVLVTGIVASVLAAFCNLTILVELCSILTLMPYTLLCYAVIIIRYKEDCTPVNMDTPSDEHHTGSKLDVLCNKHVTDSCEDRQVTEHNIKQDGINEMMAETNNEEPRHNLLTNEDVVHSDEIINSDNIKPNIILSNHPVKLRINIALLVLSISVTGIALLVRLYLSYEIETLLFSLILFVCPFLVAVLVIYKTPYKKLQIPFQMPFFPILPTLCFSTTIFVMVQFSLWAWGLFAGSITIGFFIYICYGIKNSRLQKGNMTFESKKVSRNKEEVEL